ncbi:MAG: type II toxin-antitoxin system HicB family antitoxin [Phycisphaerales bacterium]|nr:type II toxin-antitoxin system HicB family antitoxin [Hyphomonadaceae bacterium]
MAMKKTETRKPADYLQLPYTQTVVPMEDGTFHAEMPDFPGCFATGETRAKALQSLQDVAESWLRSMIERGQPIPSAPQQMSYSGKLALRLSKSLHRQAAVAAQRDGVSLNSYIVTCLAHHVGMQSPSLASYLLRDTRMQTISTTNIDMHVHTKKYEFVQMIPNLASEDA